MIFIQLTVQFILYTLQIDRIDYRNVRTFLNGVRLAAFPLWPFGFL